MGAARLEGSKLFAKKIMKKYGVPTAGHVEFTGKDEILKYINGIKEYPVVIKLDGLAAGKGVAIPENREEAAAFVNGNVKDGIGVSSRTTSRERRHRFSGYPTVRPYFHLFPHRTTSAYSTATGAPIPAEWALMPGTRSRREDV